jgi:hypothetical protein
MGKGGLIKKILVSWTVLLFVGTGILPGMSEEIKNASISEDQINNLIIDKSVLDVQYIYNITRALSNITFTEYDEEHGEIAMGRAFGTKGEHKAAEILLENMSKLGLWTYKERIKPKFPFYDLTTKIEILDCDVKINNVSIKDCYVRGITFSSKESDPESPHNFSYRNLKILREHPAPENDNEDYVLISKTFIPNFTFNGESIFSFIKGNLKKSFGKKDQTSQSHPHYIARLSYDFLINDTYDIEGAERSPFTFFINKSTGEMIKSNAENLTVDFYVNQRLNKSVESYNVIGQLNGTNRAKTVLVCCLYDGWWGQCTADSAIGMAMVLGIAKYFVDHKIKPKYNIKFIGFGGEEYGCKGSIYYEMTHRRERIIYVIDLNQLGFKQEKPRLRLEIVANNKMFLEKIWKVVEKTDYVNRTNNTADIVKILSKTGHLSDDRVFALARPLRCKTVCFLKNGEWDRHHRDGLNHQEGDVLKYFDPLDVSVTGEMVWNVTKYLAVD